MAICLNLVTMSLLLLGLAAQSSSVLAAGEACGAAQNDDPVIAAFRESGAVRDKIARYPSEEWGASCIFSVRTGGSCGVSGCGSSFLIGQEFTSKGVNPQSVTVLVTAHSDPRDPSRISSPRLVTIASADAIVAPSPWSLLCSANENRSGSETTAGQRACLDEKVKSQQSRLDGVLGKIRATMAPAGHPLDPEWSEKRLALFEQSQKAWEDYRTAACDAAYHETYPGSFAPLERLDCLYSVTGVRVQEVRRVYFSSK